MKQCTIKKNTKQCNQWTKIVKDILGSGQGWLLEGGVIQEESIFEGQRQEYSTCRNHKQFHVIEAPMIWPVNQPLSGGRDQQGGACVGQAGELELYPTGQMVESF